ncbi:MAG: tetratricopeptide repeat protein [Candidatus Brocadiaceae bacterium]|nr:tetratricopeptide repeat protein [Candidatus Brocadiaceae bacterium]
MKKSFESYCLLIIFFVSALAYLNCLQHSFVYDDESTIVHNYFIRRWNHLPKLFSSHYFSLSAELTYRPVVTLSYFIDYTFWQLNPFGYHLTNILLHTINSMLFFPFAFLVLGKKTPALISSLFFASYPLATEVVNACGFREDLLACMFLLLAFILYLRGVKRSSITSYCFSLFSFSLALFSKEMAITLPVLIICYDMALRPTAKTNGTPPPASSGKKEDCRRWFFSAQSKALYRYSGYFLVSILYLLIRFFFLHNPLEAQYASPLDRFPVNFLTMVQVLAYYTKLLFIPFPLNADYIAPLSLSPFKISFFISLFVLIAIGVCAFRLRQKNTYLFFSIIWVFITLIPVMNIIPLGNIMAERYLYLPSIGFSMIIGCFPLRRHLKPAVRPGAFLTPPPSILLIFILCFVLAGNMYLTFQRNRDWKDGTRLWSKTILTSPNSVRAHLNLGFAYEQKGLDRDAFEEYKHALSINPDDADSYNNLGIYYNTINLLDEAIQCYKKCLEINPKHIKAHNNLGVALTKQRRLDDAILEFKSALSLNAFYPDAHNNLGIAYHRKGLTDKAEREYKSAIAIEPNHAAAHNGLGIVYNDKRLYDEAIREFETAVSIKPDYANAHMNLGAVILQHGKDKKSALFHLKESLTLDPHQEQAPVIRKLVRQLK